MVACTFSWFKTIQRHTQKKPYENTKKVKAEDAVAFSKKVSLRMTQPLVDINIMSEVVKKKKKHQNNLLIQKVKRIWINLIPPENKSIYSSMIRRT